MKVYITLYINVCIFNMYRTMFKNNDKLFNTIMSQN